MNENRVGGSFSMPLSIAIAVIVLLGAWCSLLAQGDGSVVQRCIPVVRRTSELGCFITASETLGKLPDGPLYWHLDTYPTIAAAEAAKEASGTVVESLGQFWLFTIAGSDWRPSSGERVARVGPLPVVAASSHTAVYAEGTFVPGMVGAVIARPGPEAWYVLEGEQCLETSEGTLVLKAGEGGFVRAGIPMAIKSTGPGRRRALVLVLHDSTQAAGFRISDWAPKGLCGD
jgi:quercetin dioxygenase-like cupin family protein